MKYLKMEQKKQKISLISNKTILYEGKTNKQRQKETS